MSLPEHREVCGKKNCLSCRETCWGHASCEQKPFFLPHRKIKSNSVSDCLSSTFYVSQALLSALHLPLFPTTLGSF